jgi:uncharacterized membrane protein
MSDGADTSGAPDHAVERLMFFSDAVFAIAITLLVIEIHVPDIPSGSPASASWSALAHLIPHFVGFVVSFFVIAAFWGGHHRAFAVAAHWDQRLVLPNTVLLLTIAAMPFFTAFSSRDTSNPVAVPLYCTWLFLTGLASMWLQRRVTSPPVVRESADAAVVRSIRRRGLSVTTGAATALTVSLFQPTLGQAALITIPLWRMLFDRLDRRRAVIA